MDTGTTRVTGPWITSTIMGQVMIRTSAVVR